MTDHNALNLAVATKLSSMGQEWGWRHRGCDQCNTEHKILWAQLGYEHNDRCKPHNGIDICMSCHHPHLGIPLDFCTSHEAFGRLVEFLHNDDAYEVTFDTWAGKKRVGIYCLHDEKPCWQFINDDNTMVALAQAFIGGEK